MKKVEQLTKWLGEVVGGALFGPLIAKKPRTKKKKG